MERLAYIVIGGAVGVVLTVALQGANVMQHDMVTDEVDMTMSSSSINEDDICTATDMGAMHKHPPREVAAGGPIPSVSHLMFPDMMDGYNMQILPVNFDFTPAAINREAQDNEGHAHIYVNGVKVSRVYAPWFHLSAELLQAGPNEVTVTLNANDHSEWAIDGVAISSTVIVHGAPSAQ
ncbi:MAG: hypothetical protein ABJH45_19530 [Paracoccaceae bacterium]